MDTNTSMRKYKLIDLLESNYGHNIFAFLYKKDSYNLKRAFYNNSNILNRIEKFNWVSKCAKCDDTGIGFIKNYPCQRCHPELYIYSDDERFYN
jgi:hypothetical protein